MNGPQRVIVNAFGARSELRAEPHLRRESGSRPELAGRSRTTSRRASTKLAGLLEAFADSMMIGIFFEQLKVVRTWTYDGPGGLRRAGKVSAKLGAVCDGLAGSASGQHEHEHDSLHLLRALCTADQCMIRGLSESC